MKEKHICCICGCEFEGYGNNPYPLVKDEQARCCDECNEKYVVAARKDRSKIMQFRKQFGIDYTEYRK